MPPQENALPRLPAFPESLEEFHPLMRLLMDVGTEVERMQPGIGSHAKEDGSPVTPADELAEARIRQFLRLHFPSDGILGEEGTNVQGGKRWILDPIDGTSSYLRGRAEYGISVGNPDAGFLYFPTLKTLLSAAAGRGAFMDEKRLAIDTTEKIPLSRAMMSFCLAQDPGLRERYLECITPVLVRSGAHESRGSTVDAFRSVVTGQADAMIIGGATIYDLGAVVPIGKELGLPMTCPNGDLDHLPGHVNDKLFFLLARSNDLLEEILGNLRR